MSDYTRNYSDTEKQQSIANMRVRGTADKLPQEIVAITVLASYMTWSQSGSDSTERIMMSAYNTMPETTLPIGLI